MANYIQNAAPAPTGGAKPLTLQAQINKMEGEIAKALPSVITPERFTRMVLSAVSSNPKLAQCEAKSFLGAMMAAAQLGLEPNTPIGQAYIIPYSIKGVLKAQFQIGYKGLLDLCYRSGEVSTVAAYAIHENDEYEISLGLEPKLVHKPALKDRGAPIIYYAIFRTKSGGFAFDYMSVEEIRKHAEKYSQSYATGSSPWTTSFDQMAKKTILKRLLKYAPMRTDFARAVTQDETIKSELFEDMSEVQSEYSPEDIVVDTTTGEVAD